MSSGSPSSSNDVQIKQLESPSNRAKPAQPTAWKTDIHNTSSQPRLNSLTLDQLSEELDRHTTETQKLQDELENATKLTLEKFGCTYGISCSQRQSCLNGNFIGLPHDPPADSATLSTQQQPLIRPLTSDEINGSCPREGFVGECLQQLLDIPFAEEDDPRTPEARTFSFDNVIMNLQTELHKVQMEKDVLSALRLTDSTEHVGQMETMLSMLVDLQNTERAMDQKLSETENEALSLNRRVEKLEQFIKERFFSPLPQSKHCETVGAVENQVDEECSGRIQQKEKMEDLIANIGQEVALLANKLSSSKNSSVNLILKLEKLKELAEKQALLHKSQACDFVLAVSRHKNKVCYLEQQLIQAQSQLKDAQREREHFSQHSEDFQAQHYQIKQQNEFQEEVKALRGQLEKVGEKKNSLQAQLEQKTDEEMKTKDLLEEKVTEVHLLKQETQQHLDRLEEAQRQYQTLHIDSETLRLKVNDQEKMINILRLQVENNTQVAVQQSQTINILHQENSFLSDQLNQNKLNVQQLRTHLEQHKSAVAEAELAKQRLQASVVEHIKLAQEQTGEKEELSNQLKLQRIALATLKKEHRELQQLHRCKEEEYQGVVLKLQSRIKRANEELDQVRVILRDIKEANGHGPKAAVNTKERIIARREQLNPLEGKIQHLIQTVEKLNQEKHHQNLEHQLQLRELTILKKEKRQLGSELEALRSKDKHIKEWISRLEQILDKMSERFADCQDFVQLQEQEFFHLKLQPSLDSLELQGQHLHTAVNEQTAHLDPPPVVSTPLSFQRDAHAHISSQQESPTQELRSLVKELKAVISENRRPHPDNTGGTGSSFQRRRSAPERVNRTTLSTEAEEIKARLRCRGKTSGSVYSETLFLKTSEINGQTINKPFKAKPHASSPALAARYPSSAERLLLGRKSPVYYLLTSDPNQSSD